MKLIDRQIKATKKTLEQVRKEYKKGFEHHWEVPLCPLCRLGGSIRGCPKCPLDIFATEGEKRGCSNLALFSPTLEDIAGFLKSLIISLEEAK